MTPWQVQKQLKMEGRWDSTKKIPANLEQVEVKELTQAPEEIVTKKKAKKKA